MKSVKQKIDTAYSYFENKNFSNSLSLINEVEEVLLKAQCCSILEENVKVNLLSSIYDFRGFNYLGLNNLDEARAYFEKSFNVNPDSSQALVGLAEISYLNDRIEIVEEILQKINNVKAIGNYISKKLIPVELLIKSKIFYALLVRKELNSIQELIQNDQINQAEEVAQIALIVFPDDHDLLNNYSVILAMQKKYIEAIEIIEKILKTDPENEIAIENREVIRQWEIEYETVNKEKAEDKNISNLEQWKIMQDNGYFENHIYYGAGSDELPSDGLDFKFISKFVELNKNMNAAVIGCGYGRESVNIAPNVKLLFGIDVNEKILEKAVKFTRKHGINNFLPVLAGSWEEDIKEEIDFVYEIVVFQHLTRYLTSEYIRGMSNKLTKNGKILCQFLESEYGTNDAALKVYEPSVSWTMPQIEELARENGLVILKTENIPYPQFNCYWHWILFGKKNIN